MKIFDSEKFIRDQKAKKIKEVIVENYEEKSEFLRNNGWSTLWGMDHWVRNDWFEHPKAPNINNFGLTIDN